MTVIVGKHLFLHLQEFHKSSFKKKGSLIPFLKKYFSFSFLFSFIFSQQYLNFSKKVLTFPFLYFHCLIFQSSCYLCQDPFVIPVSQFQLIHFVSLKKLSGLLIYLYIFIFKSLSNLIHKIIISIFFL